LSLLSDYLRSKFEEDRSKTTVTIVDDKFSDRRTHRRTYTTDTWFYMCPMPCKF